ncbi:uncharacterized protein LOC118404558 [Branchiostoma floridae]|uniref:Uncharacterized protein LOC118404558 n=1 Tax=Branchiostoma floridae TaxID=7739 RepID=A0A9J7HHA3_BRAFL|nr:uncharacterized protein LOC118404558 [Branchiostoma floridae]
MRGAAAKCTCIVLSLLVSSLFVRTGNATGTEVFGEEGGYVDLPCAPAYDPTNNLHWQVIQRGTGSNIIFLVKEPGKDVEIRYTRLAGRLSLRDSNNLRISNLNRDDDSVDSTDPHFVGTYRCSQPQEEDPLEGDQFILRVRRTPAPPTDLEVITTQLYSVTVEVTAGNNGLEPQSLCVWYREQGTEEWKKGSGENSCSRNGVTEGEEVTLQSTLPASNTTYHICVVAQNRLNSTRCDDAYIQATTDSVASFNATIRLPNDAFISPDPNHRENQGLVDRIIDSLNNALKPAHPDLQVEVVQFREGSVLVDTKMSVGQQEIKSVKADLVSKVRSGDLTGIDVDINYLRIDDEIPRPFNRGPQGPDIVAIVLSSIAAAGVALIAGVAAYLFCRGSAKNTYIEGVKDTIEMALGLDLNKLKELTKGDANLSILLPPPAATEKPISNVRLPDTGFHDSTDCKNIVAKAGEGNSLVIIGSTGSGKTQGVLAYAKGFAEKNANAIMWFFGRSENEEKGLTKETIKEQGIELAKKFGHGNLSPEELPNKIMKSLQNRQSKSLLVFDDVTATSGIPAAYLSASEKVTVFITTCSANLDLTLPEYKMEGFTKDDVLKFLKREDKKSVEIFGKTPDEDLLKLADHFGNLPHGLSLARSYMLSSRTSVKGYLRELEERSNRVGGELKAHEKAVYGAILLAMENRMSGTSQEMLKFAAILSQDRIPIFILSKGVEISFDENPDKDEFITEVDELSLARVEGKKEEWIDGRMISVHQQTQAAILANLDEEELETMRRSLIQVFLEYFHKDTRKIQDGYINGLLLPHVEAVLNLRTISELPENYHTGLARLYETIGYMYCQKRLPEAAIFPLEKAKEMISKIVPLDTDADTIFQSLVEKGSELYGQEDVYSKNLKKRVLTTGDVGVLKTKALTLSDDFMAAAKMGKPLTEEQFQQLVQLHLAYNAEQIQQSFLVELAATVLYTSARRIFYFQGEERVQYRQTAEKDLNLSLTLSQKLASDQGLEILNKMLSQRSGTLYLLKETEGKSTEQQKEDFLLAIEGYQNLINDDKDYFENGVLKKIGDDDWHRMHCYRAIVYTYNDLITKLATTDQERADYIRLHDESAQKMVDFGEKQVKKDDKGKVIEAPEMLPEIYNMSGDFLIQMIEKGFVKPEDGNPLGRAKQWYHEALDVESIKAYHEAVSRLGLAKAFTLMYEAETAKVTTNGETRIPMHDADEKIPLVNNNPTLDEIHHLINAKEEMNKSLKIYEEELRNRTKDIQEAKKWNDRIVRHIDSLPNVPKEQESTV